MPRPEHFLPPYLTRRDVLLAVGASAMSLALPGCGGGGGNHVGGATAKPATVVGMVEPGSLVSSSGLSVSNVYQTMAPVGASGEFTTLASNEGAMLHFVTDATDKLVGASLTVPGQAVTVSAESTLQACLFLTPGVTVADPISAGQVIAQLKGQASYVAALSYLKNNLPQRALEEVLSDGIFPDLLFACISQYTPVESSSRGILVDPPPTEFSLVDRFTIDFRTDNLPATRVTLVNAGWRFVRIDRIERDPAGNVIANTEPVGRAGFNFLGGANAYDLGSVFVRNAGDAEDEMDARALNLSSVASTEYWVQGPGWRRGETLPDVLDDDRRLVLLLSLFRYVFWPLAEALLGKGFKPKSDIGLWINEIYELYDAAEEDLAVLATLFDVPDDYVEEDVKIIAKTVIAATRNIILKVFESGLFGDAIEEELKDEILGALGVLFARVKLVFVFMNIGRLVKEWIVYRPAFHTLITSSGNGGVLVK